jgi:hypothetical protein
VAHTSYGNPHRGIVSLAQWFSLLCALRSCLNPTVVVKLSLIAFAVPFETDWVENPVSQDHPNSLGLHHTTSGGANPNSSCSLFRRYNQMEVQSATSLIGTCCEFPDGCRMGSQLFIYSFINSLITRILVRRESIRHCRQGEAAPMTYSPFGGGQEKQFLPIIKIKLGCFRLFFLFYSEGKDHVQIYSFFRVSKCRTFRERR